MFMQDDPLSPRDEQRRRLLVALLACGAFSRYAVAAPLLGLRPGLLPDSKSIYLLEGSVQVNGTAATKETHIPAGALVETGERSKVIFRVDKDAFILRAESRLQLEGDDSVVVETLRLVTGRLLSVFGRPAPHDAHQHRYDRDPRYGCLCRIGTRPQLRVHLLRRHRNCLVGRSERF